jgi:hypothetical protein
VRALVAASDHRRQGVIDALLAAGASIDALDPVSAAIRRAVPPSTAGPTAALDAPLG